MLIIPTSTKGMGNELKKILDQHTRGLKNIDECKADLNELHKRCGDLFFKAQKERWIGKKRLSLLNAIMLIDSGNNANRF